MWLLARRKDTAVSSSKYATVDDFGALFESQMTELYQLAFLLIADSEKAEQCFIAAFEDCAREDSVFKEWAHSWSRRSIVENAIQMMRAQEVAGVESANSPAGDTKPAEAYPANTDLAGILRLGDRERVVFVLSFLEKYSDQRSARLLGCSRQDVRKIRKKVLQGLVDACGNIIRSEETNLAADPSPFKAETFLRRSCETVTYSSTVQMSSL